MSKQKDYYDVLGVGRDASADEIRSNYRKLARQYHTDVNKDPQAKEIFIEINEAYEVLSNGEKRAEYDRFGHPREATQNAAPQGFEGYGFKDIFGRGYGTNINAGPNIGGMFTEAFTTRMSGQQASGGNNANSPSKPQNVYRTANPSNTVFQSRAQTQSNPNPPKPAVSFINELQYKIGNNDIALLAAMRKALQEGKDCLFEIKATDLGQNEDNPLIEDKVVYRLEYKNGEFNLLINPAIFQKSHEKGKPIIFVDETRNRLPQTQFIPIDFIKTSFGYVSRKHLDTNLNDVPNKLGEYYKALESIARNNLTEEDYQEISNTLDNFFYLTTYYEEEGRGAFSTGRLKYRSLTNTQIKEGIDLSLREGLVTKVEDFETKEGSTDEIQTILHR